MLWGWSRSLSDRCSDYFRASAGDRRLYLVDYFGTCITVATAISNITLVRAIKYAGPTLTSILGAMEPLTAVVIGVFVFKELFTLNSAIGILLILLAVGMVIFRKQKIKEDIIKKCCFT